MISVVGGTGEKWDMGKLGHRRVVGFLYQARH